MVESEAIGYHRELVYLFPPLSTERACKQVFSFKSSESKTLEVAAYTRTAEEETQKAACQTVIEYSVKDDQGNVVLSAHAPFLSWGDMSPPMTEMRGAYLVPSKSDRLWGSPPSRGGNARFQAVAGRTYTIEIRIAPESCASMSFVLALLGERTHIPWAL
jgi:hypothetical protein